METTVINATEYRELPLALLNESKTNPRRIFDEVSLRELAASIRSQGVLSPLLVRPLTETASRSWPVRGGIAPRRWPKLSQYLCASSK